MGHVQVVMTVAFLVICRRFHGGRLNFRDLAAEAKATITIRGPILSIVSSAPTPQSSQPADVSAQAEAGRILVNILRHKDSGGADDEPYLAKLVSAKTGLSQAEAARRVSQVSLEARQAEDAARQTASRLLLWSFLALLMGAFAASYAATIGGRQRDHVKAI